MEIGTDHTIMPRRPMLSCWENNVWSYHGQKGAASQLTSLSNLDMPDGLAKHFYKAPSIDTPLLTNE